MHALRRYVHQGMDAKGWTPADLARASGITKQTVSNILTDDREIRQAFLLGARSTASQKPSPSVNPS